MLTQPLQLFICVTCEFYFHPAVLDFTTLWLLDPFISPFSPPISPFSPHFSIFSPISPFSPPFLHFHTYFSIFSPFLHFRHFSISSFIAILISISLLITPSPYISPKTPDVGNASVGHLLALVLQREKKKIKVRKGWKLKRFYSISYPPIYRHSLIRTSGSYF